MRRIGSLLLGVLILVTSVDAATAALRADELLLVANGSVAESEPLARYYAQVRNVPADRVLVLKTRAGEEITLDEYDARVAAPVRAYLQSPAGANVRCVVLFYGVPLRVSNISSTPAQRNELQRVRVLIDTAGAQLPATADRLDVAVRTCGATPQVINLPGVPVATVARLRAEAAGRALEKLFREAPLVQRQAIAGALQEIQKALIAAAESTLRTPAATQPVFDAFARHAADRERVAKQAGLFALYGLLEVQSRELTTDETEASIDSELACVLWPAYLKYRWQVNPLAVGAGAQGPTNARTIMTARVDGPTSQIARRIIDDAISVEQTGLQGRVALDSRGKVINPAQQPPDGYATYDQTIRNAVTFIKKNTTLDVFTDDREALIPPGAATDVALYCGWYSVRNYIPSCTFARGAVAYHVASAELVSLRTPGERGWGANLLRDGACVTIGAVSEPYLHSFPTPDVFFPLLLTGKMTVAEAYWLSVPMTSWMQIFIGDPLYNPYKQKPALSPDALSPQLKSAVDKIEAPAAAGR